MKQLIIFLLLSSVAFSQQTFKLAVNKYNTLYSNNDMASAGAASTFIVGQSATSNIKRALIQFDFSTIRNSVDIKIDSAKIVVRLAKESRSNPSGDLTAGVHRLLQNWGQGTSGAGSNASGRGVSASPNSATHNCRFFMSNGCDSTWADNYYVSDSTIFEVPSSSSVGDTFVIKGTLLDNDVRYFIQNPSRNFGWLLNSISSNDKSGYHFSSTGANAAYLTVYTSSVGLNELADISSQLSAFPNPSSQNTTTISLGQHYKTISLLVSDQLGRVVQKESYQNTKRIELPSNFKAGMYFIKVQTENAQGTVKLLKL